MGYSPGEFTCKVNGLVHWELKAGGRIILWDENESRMLLDLSIESATEAMGQFDLLVKMGLGDD